MNLWLKFKDLTPHAIRSNQNQYTRTSAIISMVSSYLSLEIIKREREREKELVYVRERDWDKENKDRPKRSAPESDRKSSEHARDRKYNICKLLLCAHSLLSVSVCFFCPSSFTHNSSNSRDLQDKTKNKSHWVSEKIRD